MLICSLVPNQTSRWAFCGAKNGKGRFLGGTALGFTVSGGRAWVDKEGWVHREDGPAMEWDSGFKGWYRHGEEIADPRGTIL